MLLSTCARVSCPIAAPTAAATAAAPMVSARGMATLRDTRTRMKSVQSIGKITASMKMVAAARLRIAQMTLENTARPFADFSNRTPRAIFSPQSAAAGGKEGATTSSSSAEGKKQLFVPVTSDRGLCGSINSTIIKTVRADARKVKPEELQLAVVGTKGKAGLQRERGSQFQFAAFDLTKRLPINFCDVLAVADRISSIDADTITVTYQRFVSIIASEPTRIFIQSRASAADADLSKYEFDEMKSEVLENLYEWYLATSLYGAAVEHSTAELGARMSAMDNATKNSKEMLSKLTLMYNRRRQAGITTELCEIVAGAEAIKG